MVRISVSASSPSRLSRMSESGSTIRILAARSISRLVISGLRPWFIEYILNDASGPSNDPLASMRCPVLAAEAEGDDLRRLTFGGGHAGWCDDHGVGDGQAGGGTRGEDFLPREPT